jgi:hypothetical protein
MKFHVPIIIGLLAGCPRQPPRSVTTAPEATPSHRYPQQPIVVEGETTRIVDMTFDEDGPIALGSGAGRLTIGQHELAAGGDAFVVALTWDGRVRFVHRLRSEAHIIHDGLVRLDDGGVLFVGSFHGSIELGDLHEDASGPRDCFVARLDDRGRPLFLRRWGGTGEALCRDVALVGDDAWVVGSFSGELSAGDRALESVGSLDVVLGQLRLRDGAVTSGFSFGTPAEDVGRGIVAPDTGALVVSGSYGSPWGAEGEFDLSLARRSLTLGPAAVLEGVGDADGFIAQMDASGRTHWATPQAGPGFDVVKQLTISGDGVTATVVSQTSAPPPGVSGMASDVPLSGYVVQLGPDGRERWRWSDPALISPSGIVTTKRGVAFAATYRDGLVAGDVRWSAEGESDALWIEVDGSGRFVRGEHCGGPGMDLAIAIGVDATQRVLLGGRAEAASDCVPRESSGGFLRWSARPQ